MTHIVPHPMQLFSCLENTFLKVHTATILDAYRHMERELWTPYFYILICPMGSCKGW